MLLEVYRRRCRVHGSAYLSFCRAAHHLSASPSLINMLYVIFKLSHSLQNTIKKFLSDFNYRYVLNMHFFKNKNLNERHFKKVFDLNESTVNYIEFIDINFTESFSCF